MFMKKSTFFFALFFSATFSFSQTLTDIAFKTAATSTPDVVLCNFFIQLSDTTQIDKIEIDLGTKDGTSDLIDFSFDYDIVSGLPAGFSYVRNGNSVSVETGTIAEYPMYFGRVRLKKSNGQFTDYFSFTSN